MGSRYYKIGTIHSRAKGLITSKVMREKPVWFDIYEAFPPKVEPRFDRAEPTSSIRAIFYPEDALRAKFYQKIENVGIINLSESSKRQTVCQLFIEEYMKLEKEKNLSEEELWDETVASLESRGIRLTKRVFTKSEKPSYAEKREPMKIKLADVISFLKE